MHQNDALKDHGLIFHRFQDDILGRLRESGVTKARRHQAIAVLWVIIRNLGWQDFRCRVTTHELCDITGIDQGEMTRALKLLERVGAIHRIKGTRPKVITISPEHAYFGDLNQREGVLVDFQRTVHSP